MAGECDHAEPAVRANRLAQGIVERVAGSVNSATVRG